MISREELYRLVWSEPMTKVAQRFEVSGSYLARVCTVLNVPRPERGYWSKLAVGKAPKADPLPEARPGDQTSWSKDGELPMPPKLRLPPRRRLDTPVRIPRTKVHGLIRGAKEHFENSRPVDEGAYLRPFKKLLVDVTTSKACLDKALDFANDLFNAFGSVGHRVVIAPPDEHLHGTTPDEREVRSKERNPYYHSGLWSPNRPTVVYIGSVAIGVSVVEMSEEVLMRHVNGKYIRDADYVPPVRSRDYTWTTTRTLPTGRLRLIAYSPYWRVTWSSDWQETKQKSLRPSVKSIVQSVEEAAVDMVGKLEEADRQAEIQRIEREAAEERRRREEDRRRVEQSIQDSKDHLGKVIQQWSHVMSVERFLVGVEQRAHELPDDDRGAVLERLKLARDFLGTQDPLEFFRSWKTPEERHRPLYPNTDPNEA
ncbi:hypothetical protein [Mesorhizobium sp. M8A.F.Ca.ET.021.01.1.1]|uniref:hypothetical protein n=1 Tax=Mesorhizobium sp. M8A.F.Ca.ET.021.01.1.1 TaxID=2496757 RepID=UPI000FCBD1C8|nr:hypothetical protein [Mesorhizobium sp. M8A.F.Ca.ET.021.01.1.1]RUW57014.1 hypothetical protein EOA36_01500 [Mesorhizobium sp. M8A.F.Ca.ET.021.01.1.1]